MKDAVEIQKRQGFILIRFFIILVFIYIIKLFYMQVINYKYYYEKAKDNMLKTDYSSAPRGKILDRNNKMLADFFLSYQLVVIPQKITNNPDVLSSIAKMTNRINLDEVAAILNDVKNPLNPVVIYTFIDTFSVKKGNKQRDEEMAFLHKIWQSQNEYPGIEIHKVPLRSYRYPENLCHVLGYVGEITAEQLIKLNLDNPNLYIPGDQVGRSGIEKQYEDKLHGKRGRSSKLITAKGRHLTSETIVESAVPGKDLVLTIDVDLQNAAQTALENRFAGTVIAMNPKTGEILALACTPTFNANMLSRGVSVKLWKAISQDPLHPLLNRAIQAAYPPASTFKVVTAGAALQARLISPFEMLKPCTGRYRYGDRLFYCWEKTGHGGNLDLNKGMTYSCDIYFYQVAERLGLERLTEYSKLCGFGFLSGIDIPYERRGLVPSERYYNLVFGKGNWGRGVSLNLAIGQGEMLVTPIQLITLFSGIANDGVVVQPHVLKEIRFQGKLEEKFIPKTYHLPFSKQNIQYIKEAARRVIAAKNATGKEARIKGLETAGKTGTAQNPHGPNHAWFVGFAPVNDPEICVVVFLEHGIAGGTYAAPIFRKVVQSYFALKNKRIKDGSSANYLAGDKEVQTGI
ncbi:MAG: penicillin-binding protein 2 [Candidatus Coatesbacteria bacterium]|nr:penicillin-binding protein 2 [Candidatus Coatesbacteria bacterium]